MIRTSLYWKNHFEVNLTRQRVNWSISPTISQDQKIQLLYSIKAWQLGETSDGSHLLAAARKYAAKIGDEDYVDAVKLFIKEEQKHGNNLGKYIDAICEKRTKKDWGDTLFRKFRYLNTSMELWTIAVIIVESAAQLFYKALHDATECQLLRSICRDILMDEAHHIQFQNERLYMIFHRKNFYVKAITLLFYGVLFFVTIHLVWLGHRKAFKAGLLDKKEFMKQMYYKFFKAMQFLHARHEEKTVNISLV